MTQLYRRESYLSDARVFDELFLDIKYPRHITPSTRDVEREVEPKYAERPDVLAYDIYGNSRFWWVFAARNPDLLKDPIRDLTAGKVIFLPSEDTVLKGGS